MPHIPGFLQVRCKVQPFILQKECDGNDFVKCIFWVHFFTYNGFPVHPKTRACNLGAVFYKVNIPPLCPIKVSEFTSEIFWSSVLFVFYGLDQIVYVHVFDRRDKQIDESWDSLLGIVVCSCHLIHPSQKKGKSLLLTSVLSKLCWFSFLGIPS